MGIRQLTLPACERRYPDFYHGQQHTQKHLKDSPVRSIHSLPPVAFVVSSLASDRSCAPDSGRRRSAGRMRVRIQCRSDHPACPVMFPQQGGLPPRRIALGGHGRGERAYDLQDRRNRQPASRRAAGGGWRAR